MCFIDLELITVNHYDYSPAFTHLSGQAKIYQKHFGFFRLVSLVVFPTRIFLKALDLIHNGERKRLFSPS